MYQIIGHPASRAGRVIWMMEELGVDYEIVPVGPHSDKINEINPSGKLPALLVDGEVVIDSVAICQFLADKHGKLTHPAGTIERAHQDSFTQFACDDVEYGLWTEAKHRFVYPEQHRIEGIKGICAWEFGRAMKVLEKRFGDGPFITGTEFTVPDLLLGDMGRWGRAIEFEIPEGKLSDYFDRVLERPARARALERADAALEKAA